MIWKVAELASGDQFRPWHRRSVSHRVVASSGGGNLRKLGGIFEGKGNLWETSRRRGNLLGTQAWWRSSYQSTTFGNSQFRANNHFWLPIKQNGVVWRGRAVLLFDQNRYKRNRFRFSWLWRFQHWGNTLLFHMHLNIQNKFWPKIVVFSWTSFWIYVGLLHPGPRCEDCEDVFLPLMVIMQCGLLL